MGERVSAYNALSRCIAHEMRKPLAFIDISCQGWSNNSHHLFKAYEVAVESGPEFDS